MNRPYDDFIRFMSRGKQLCDYNSDIVDSSLIEGKSDIKDTGVYSSQYDELISMLSSNTHDGTVTINFNKTNIEVMASGRNLPTVIFNFDSEINSGHGYNPKYDIMMINVPELYDTYVRSIEQRNMSALIDELHTYTAVFIHEMSHRRDRINNFTPDKYFPEHDKQVDVILNNIYSAVSQVLGKHVFKNDIDNINYLNTYTEYNSRVLQYIWQCIEQFITHDKYGMSFRDFVNPFVKDDNPYFTEPVKRRIIKRLYYVWGLIQQLTPHLHSLSTQTTKDIHNKLLSLVESECCEEHPITELYADMAVKVILMESHLLSEHERKLGFGLVRRWNAINYNSDGWDTDDFRSINDL